MKSELKREEKTKEKKNNKRTKTIISKKTDLN